MCSEEQDPAQFEGFRWWRGCPACGDVTEHEEDPGTGLTCELCGCMSEDFADEGMHSTFACPQCQNVFSVEDDARGDLVRCDACPWQGHGSGDGAA